MYNKFSISVNKSPSECSDDIDINEIQSFLAEAKAIAKLEPVSSLSDTNEAAYLIPKKPKRVKSKRRLGKTVPCDSSDDDGFCSTRTISRSR